MVAGTLLIMLLPPDGRQVDITSRVDLGAAGSVSETLEDNLLELTHSDFDLEIQDEDGEISEMLRNSSRDETWAVRVERYAGGRRDKWQLVFAGILDTPLSVEIDRKNRTVSVQVFSYSKLMERIDPSGQRRDRGEYPDTVTGQKVSATAGSAVLGFSPGFSTDSFLKIGDRIAIDDGTNREEHIISATVGTSGANTIEPVVNDFDEANAELLTPWPWHQTIEEIAASLLAVVGVDGVDIDIESVTAERPFLSGFDGNGSGTGWNQLKNTMAWDLTGDNHKIMVRIDTAMYVAESPSSGFEGEAATTQVEADWTPYLSTQPGSLELVPSDVQNGDGTDTQLNFAEVPADDLDWVACYDHEGGDTWTLRHDHTVGLDDPRLRLFKNGSFAANIHVESGVTADHFHTAFCDWFDRSADGYTDDLVVISSQGHNGVREVNVYDGTSKTTVASGDGSGGGGVRTIASRRRVAIQTADEDLNQPQIRADINFWKSVSDADGFIAIDRTLQDQPAMQMWTMRSFGDFVACMYLGDTGATQSSHTGFVDRETRVRVWRWSDLEQVADFKLHDFAHPHMYATTAKFGGVESVVFNVNRFMTVLSTEWVGTVPYLNFDDISGERAIRDIALLSMSYFEIDRFGIARFRNRASDQGPVVEIDASKLIEDVEQPLTDDYVASIEVNGKDREGEEFSVVVGDKHDSSNRESIESDMIRDTGLAEAMGWGYYGILAGLRRERNVTRKLDRTWTHANDLAKIDNVPYRVISAETDLEAGEQDLKLVEVLR